MKHYLAVLAGAMSYGILSTIVVLAYGRGYRLGEVVGSQLVAGVILSWLLVIYIRFTKGRKARKTGQEQGAAGLNPVSRRLRWKQRLILMIAGTPTVITGLVYYQSLRYIPASLAIILLFQFTWISVLIQALIKRQRPNRVTLLTLFVLFGGTLIAAGFLEQGLSRINVRGIALGLMSAVSYSLFVLFSGKVVPTAHPAYRSAWMVTGGFILLCILFPPAFLFNGMIWSPLLLIGLLLGFFGAFIPPVLFVFGVPHIGGGMAGILGAVELPVAVLMSATVLREQVSGWQWLGVAVVLVGIALPELYRFTQARKAHKYGRIAAYADR
ncbi:Threonine/homoserine efflux transporter RhtA [Cohnella sp. OV330]|uniref:EamA family transporter n=1 Tax=Cohnella sp. OV330 TaxID=1855288 RepID=UPI0008E28267|nr:DMT family transporter [Cohnella sp. OV330]SFB52066.1 Threonine/homoserine efflux transporter RhtA [Cohnella sp. OV330]